MSLFFRSARPAAAHLLPCRRSAHTTVRVIALARFPNGKARKNDVVEVKPGFARNVLLPNKIAIYATPQNFLKLQLTDPKYKKSTESQDVQSKNVQQTQAELLTKYLDNKVLKIWRMIDPSTLDRIHPGKVTAKNLRKKLNKQLRIQLEPHETITILTKDPVDFEEMSPVESAKILHANVGHEDENIEIRKLGSYLARISLAGNHKVMLKFSVLERRMPKKREVY